MTTRVDYFAGRPDRVAALRAACDSWRETPFRERSAVKGAGGGVDCASFIGCSFHECGAVDERVTVPPYPLNHAEHSEESMFRAWFAQPAVRARVRVVDQDEPHVDGDIVFPRVGRAEHHAGLRLGKMVYHIARPSGWCCMGVEQLAFAGYGLHRTRYRLTA